MINDEELTTEELESIEQLTEEQAEVGLQLTEEEIAEREDLLTVALNKLKSYNLEWNFRSMNYIIEKEDVTFNQLRSCLYKSSNKELKYDLIKSIILIIKSGLIGSKQVGEADSVNLEYKANEILEDWRVNIGFIGVLHILLIKTMEEKHFFMDTQDLKILELLSLKNQMTDVVNSHLAIDLENKLNQSRALQ